MTAPDPYCRICGGRGFVWGPIHFPGFAPRMDWLPCSCMPVTEVRGYVVFGILLCILGLVAFCFWGPR